MSCRDYIFYSRGRFEVKRVLLLPSLAQLTEGEDPRQPLTVPDGYWGFHNRHFHPPEIPQEGKESGRRRGNNNNEDNNNNKEEGEEEEESPLSVTKDFGPWSCMPLPLPSPGRIFESSISPFSTTDANGGTGAGSAVAKDIARLRLQIDNVLKRSANFSGSRPVALYMGEPQKRASSPAKAMKREMEEKQAAEEANFWVGGD